MAGWRLARLTGAESPSLQSIYVYQSTAKIQERCPSVGSCMYAPTVPTSTGLPAHDSASGFERDGDHRGVCTPGIFMAREAVGGRRRLAGVLGR